MRMRGWIIDGADNQDAGEQQTLHEEKRPGQGQTAPVERFGDQLHGADGADEDGNGEDLGHVGWSAAHQQSRDHHQVAGDVGGKELAEAQETNHVSHARDHAEQRRKPALQTRHIGTVM